MRKVSIKNILLATVLLAVSNVFSQEKIRLELTDRIIDTQIQKSQAIVPVFKYTGMPFEEISEFGLKLSKKDKIKTFSVKFPDMTGMKDTSYSYLFFGGNEENQPVGYVFCLIGNNSRNDGNTYIWIDRNMNLDLSDDGAPDTFSNDLDIVHEIKLYNPKNKDAYHSVYISRFEFGKSIQYKKLLNEHYEHNSGNKRFSGADYSFKEQRMNILSAKYNDGTDSFIIALKDYNCNGLYNDAEFDEIIVDKYQTEVLDGVIFNQEGKELSFEWNLKKYIVTKIDPAGNYIEFKHSPNSLLDRQLPYCKKIPKFRVQPADDEFKPVKIRKFKKKPVYIYIWDFESPQTAEDTAILAEIQRDFGDKIHIVALNYGDMPRKVFGWQHRNNVQYFNGIASKKILDKMYVHTLPASFLLNKKQRLCEINLSSQELLERLKNKYK